jgi:hypothetical protein
MRGTGFYNWMTSPSPKDKLSEAMSATPLEAKASVTFRRLPVVNFLNIDDDKYVDAMIEEALLEDRTRFRQYLSNRPLGLGIVAAVCPSIPIRHDNQMLI